MTDTVLSPLLNEELVKRALESFHNVSNECSIQLKACDFKLSSAGGENFCSEIYQVDAKYKVNGSTFSKSLIVKILLPEVAAAGSNEEIMYNTFLPAMETCLTFGDGDNENKLHAKCLIGEHRNKHDAFYVLENLNSLGYYCGDRVKGLSLQQALILMRKIAKFHAASMILAKKSPSLLRYLRGSKFENGAHDAVAQAIIFGGFEYVGKMLEDWPSFKNLSQKVYSIARNFNRLVMDVVNARNSKFNVINHGDLWVNNFLFKYDRATGNPIDAVFVDFENCFWGSCGFDINWFLYTSLELDILKHKRSQLIQSYYEMLNHTLCKENYPTEEIPAFNDVLLEIKRCDIIAVYTSLCEFPIVALDKSKSQGFDCNTLCQPDKMAEMRVFMYANSRVKKTLQYTLKYFEELNMF